VDLASKTDLTGGLDRMAGCPAVAQYYDFLVCHILPRLLLEKDGLKNSDAVQADAEPFHRKVIQQQWEFAFQLTEYVKPLIGCQSPR
jgi:hypothetical protein